MQMVGWSEGLFGRAWRQPLRTEICTTCWRDRESREVSFIHVDPFDQLCLLMPTASRTFARPSNYITTIDVAIGVEVTFVAVASVALGHAPRTSLSIPGKRSAVCVVVNGLTTVQLDPSEILYAVYIVCCDSGYIASDRCRASLFILYPHYRDGRLQGEDTDYHTPHLRKYARNQRRLDLAITKEVEPKTACCVMEIHAKMCSKYVRVR